MARPAVDVRRAVADDVDELLVLWSQARDELDRWGRVLTGPPPEVLRPRVQAVVEDPDLEVLVARWDERAVGYVMCRVAALTPLTDTPVLQVEHLFVAPDLRRHGVARALLSTVAGIAERCGAEQVVSNVSPAARETHRFFARLGFTPLVVRRVVATSMLRRRLTGGESRRGLEDLLSRRRALRGRTVRQRPEPVTAAAAADAVDAAAVMVTDVVPTPAAAVPPTLELPVISEGAPRLA